MFLLSLFCSSVSETLHNRIKEKNLDFEEVIASFRQVDSHFD